MSVYIPGMEMPKNCHECDSWGLSDVVTIDCPVDKDGRLYSYTDRPQCCPLVPVPEHDGPLVDAIEVIRTFPDEFIFTNEQARALTNYIIPADKEEQI